MKFFITVFSVVFILSFSSSSTAGIGDVYYCRDGITVKVEESNINRYKLYDSETFKFLLTKDKITFSDVGGTWHGFFGGLTLQVNGIPFEGYFHAVSEASNEHGVFNLGVLYYKQGNFWYTLNNGQKAVIVTAKCIVS